VIITVTAEKDMPELKVFLSSDPQTLIEDAQSWKDKGVSWGVDVQANSPRTFTRKVRFPSNEGIYNLIAEVYTPSIHAVDSIKIHLTRAGGKVYLSGTSIPVTSGPLPTVTPGPSPTFIPTPTRFVSPLSTPMRSLSPLATPAR
jgi:hypothetical protein